MDKKIFTATLCACVAFFTAIFSSTVVQRHMLGELPYADLVVQNAIIYTSDPKLPWAEAMAVRRGRIVGVGNLSSVQEFIGKGTWLLDLEEKMVVPGFIDSHVHFISGGLQMGQVDLRKVKSKQEFIMKIERAASTTERGNWILGGGWNDDNWGGELPEASWIDNVSEHNPVSHKEFIFVLCRPSNHYTAGFLL
eukprot:TRINITY_DN1893_c0_g1_i4.p1 TRINITY_DN1893_c0_g1~~TRINITY_DN1893_c0_g1_i4.p1  ORF type:complete len:194 (-),score=34.34 TRINITY_DN1893_c0_g1_i4:31-612(-)